MTRLLTYFIRAGLDGPIKIGHTTKHLESKLRQFTTYCPYKALILGVTRLEENYVLSKFEALRLPDKKEWFEASEPLLQFIVKNHHDDLLEPSERGLVYPPVFETAKVAKPETLDPEPETLDPDAVAFLNAYVEPHETGCINAQVLYDRFEIWVSRNKTACSFHQFNACVRDLFNVTLSGSFELDPHTSERTHSYWQGIWWDYWPDCDNMFLSDLRGVPPLTCPKCSCTLSREKKDYNYDHFETKQGANL